MGGGGLEKQNEHALYIMPVFQEVRSFFFMWNLVLNSGLRY